ncbi:MAG: hypothetical protein HC877_11450 [Thioploca sp.]|nr:hypothetical protein [Thioploca sp.]
MIKTPSITEGSGMAITYDENKDILSIQLNDNPIVGVLSYGNQVNVKLTKKGVGKITIREVKASGLLPIAISPPELIVIHNQSITMKDRKSKLKKKCCKKYKKGKQCLNCPKLA